MPAHRSRRGNRLKQTRNQKDGLPAQDAHRSVKESANAVDSSRVRLIPEGHSANRSLSAIEPVSATAKRKLENGEQRPAPETRPLRAEMPQIAGQRLGRASLTRGNVADSHTPGNNTPQSMHFICIA